MLDGHKIYFVKLGHKMAKGTVLWATHVEASDKEGAILEAAAQMKAELNFPPSLLQYSVVDVFEDPEGAHPHISEPADNEGE